jgi:hypothetical protein
MNHFNPKFVFAYGVVALLCLLMMDNVAVGQTPPPGKNNIVLTGFLNTKDRAGIYAVHYIELTAGRTYEIRLASSEMSTRLVLEDLPGEELANDASSDELHGCIVFRAPASESYRLKIDGTEPVHEGFYTITVRELPMVMNVEAEMVPAAIMTHDVEMIAGHRYVIDLVSPEFTTYLRLLNGDDAVVAFADEGTMRTPARIVFVPTHTGTYRILSAATEPTVSGLFNLTMCEN